MGCGCKDSNVNEVMEKEPISVKSVLSKIGGVIGMSLLLLILTPFIVSLIWYYGISGVLGGKANTLNLLYKYLQKEQDRGNDTKEINDETVDYELMDVDVIK